MEDYRDPGEIFGSSFAYSTNGECFTVSEYRTHCVLAPALAFAAFLPTLCFPSPSFNNTAARVPYTFCAFYSSHLLYPLTVVTTMADIKEEVPASPHCSGYVQSDRMSLDTISPGVARIEATVEHLTSANRACIFFSVLLIAWAYGLDSVLRVAFQPIAVNALQAHSLLATVSVARAVIGAAAQVDDPMVRS
jgi:hypothetical protein